MVIHGIIALVFASLVMGPAFGCQMENPRRAVAALLVVGVLLCGWGVGRVAARGDWLHPLAITGYVLGALALVWGTAALAGRPLAPFADHRLTFMALAGLISAKSVIAAVHAMLR